MNYTELVTAISDYTENTFSTADMNTFIQQTEQRVYNTVQFPALRKTATSLATITGGQYVEAPVDFLAVHSLAVVDPVTGNYANLLNKDSTFMQEAYPNPSFTAQPKYYALYGPGAGSGASSNLKFSFGPTPDKAYQVVLQYFFYPESIVTAGSTWLSINFSPVLLYGALVEAYTQMKGDDDMIKLYDSKFKEALLIAKRLGDGMEKTSTYQSGEPKASST